MIEILKGKRGTDGKNGTNGKSAYEIAVKLGFKGSQKECLNSLNDKKGTDGVKGTNGINGTNGKTAYEITVEQGFEGDKEAWLKSLIGNKGTKCDTGYWSKDDAKRLISEWLKKNKEKEILVF